MKDWKKRCTKYYGPLLPCDVAMAAKWLGRKLKLRLGFTTWMLRKDDGIYIKQNGQTIRGWSVPA